MKLKDIVTSDYLSYGIDSDEEHSYWYLQTAHNNYEDVEIFSSKYKVLTLMVGKIFSIIFGKRLIKW